MMIDARASFHPLDATLIRRVGRQRASVAQVSVVLPRTPVIVAPQVPTDARTRGDDVRFFVTAYLAGLAFFLAMLL